MSSRIATYAAVVVAALGAGLAVPAAAAAEASMPSVLGLVQVKVFGADGGDHVRTETFHDVTLEAGKARVELAGVERNQVLAVKVHAKDGNQNNLESQTKVALRPDLTLRRLTAPARVVRKQQFTVVAELAEAAGDLGADATVT